MLFKIQEMCIFASRSCAWFPSQLYTFTESKLLILVKQKVIRFCIRTLHHDTDNIWLLNTQWWEWNRLHQLAGGRWHRIWMMGHETVNQPSDFYQTSVFCVGRNMCAFVCVCPLARLEETCVYKYMTKYTWRNLQIICEGVNAISQVYMAKVMQNVENFHICVYTH